MERKFIMANYLKKIKTLKIYLLLNFLKIFLAYLKQHRIIVLKNKLYV